MRRVRSAVMSAVRDDCHRRPGAKASAERSQAIMEFLTTYGWAILVITIVGGMLVMYASYPTSLAPNTCSLLASAGELECTDIVVSTNQISGITSAYLYMENQAPYAVANVMASVNLTSGANSIIVACLPAFLPPGTAAICGIPLPQKFTGIHELITGYITISMASCGLLVNYSLQAENCANAPTTSEAGSFTAHNQFGAPTTTTTTTSSTTTTAATTVTSSTTTTVGTATTTLPPTFIYAASKTGPNAVLYEISSATYQVVATIALDTSVTPSAMAMSPNGKYAYVVIQEAQGRLYTVSLAAGAVVNTVSSSSLGSATGIVVTPGGGDVYVTAQAASVVEVDTGTNTVVNTISLNPTYNPTGIAITPDGTKLYVTISQGYVVSVDAARNQVENIISMAGGSSPQDITVLPNGQYAYTGNQNTHDTSRITVSNDIVSNTVSVGGCNPYGIGSEPNDQNIYLLCHGGPAGDGVYIISTSTEQVTNSITSVGNPPDAIAVTKDSQYMYVGDKGSGNVYVVSTATDSTVATVNTGGSHIYAIGIPGSS